MTKKVTLYFVVFSALVALILLGYVKGTEEEYRVRYEPGETYTYQLEYVSEASGHASGYAEAANLIAAQVNVHYEFKGKMNIHVLEETISGYKLEFTFDAESFKASLNEETNWVWPSDIVVKGHLNRAGQLSELQFQEQYFLEYAQVLKEWMSQFQVSLSNRGKVRWQTKEEDFTSPYDVSYSIAAHSIPSVDLMLTKQFIPTNPQVRMDQTTDITINRLFERIETIETHRDRSTFSANRLMAKENMHLTLHFLSTSKTGLSKPELLGAVIEDTLSGEYQKQALKQQMYANTLANTDPDGFSGRLRSTPSMGNQALSKLFFELRAWVSLNPSELNQIESWLRLYNANHPSFQMLSALLVNIGTPEAQNILLRVLDTSSISKQQAIMLKLAFLANPTKESVAAVSAMANSLYKREDQVQAKLVLGSMANHLLDSDQVRGDEIYQKLSQELDGASDASQIAESLSVIGNIGSPKQTEKVKSYLNHEEKSVRHAAVNALRFVNTPEAQSVLLDSLKAEDERVRELASSGLGYTTPQKEFISVYRKRLFEETNQQVIKQLMDLLGNMSTQYPSAIAVLEEYVPTIGITSLKNYGESVLEQVKS
ncbi:HEAT repeat domain-containing protein [Vibrio penaeicida]|uniref:HEAT repeat domain-containing protein n=1 Tax=Vibrio penaeicida TaxID=104609 RepID=UPI000CEA06CA|nr:HEAT repeat domain-containing protein [Vibrio penaeicida]